MSNKFTEILSATGNQVLKKRADIIGRAAADEARDLVQSIEKEIRNLDLEIMNLEDLSVKSTDSLVVGDNFQASEWVKRMMDLEDRRRDANIRLELAKKIQNKYFVETPSAE